MDVTVHLFDGKAARQIGRRPLVLVTSEGKAFLGFVIRGRESGIKEGRRGKRSV